MKRYQLSRKCIAGCLHAILSMGVFVSDAQAFDGLESGGSDRQEQEDNLDLRVDLVVVMDDQKMNQLRQFGGLRVKVPTIYRDGVNSLLIKQENSFLSRPIVLSEDAERIGDKVLCKIDQSILNHLPYQPVRIQIYHSDYESVLIGYAPEERILPNQLTTDFGKDSGMVWANLKDGRSLPGRVRNGKAIHFKSQLGELPIPWDKISSIEWPGDLSTESTILLENGDRMQGQLNVEKFEWLTRWGSLSFNSSELASITRSAPEKQNQTEDKPSVQTNLQSK